MGSFAVGGERVELGRKGFFYLFVTVIFLLVVLILVKLRTPSLDSFEAVQARVKTMNDFIRDFNNDASKASYIAGYRALLAMEEELSLTGSFFQDADEAFLEAFYNGTINGKNKSVLENSSFSHYLASVNSIAGRIGISLDSKATISLYQEDPWSITVKVVLNNNVTDLKGLASWSYQHQVLTRLSILSLRDPLYVVGTLGRVPNTIRASNYSYFINDTNDANDTTNLLSHLNKSLYIASPSAPSYLMRMEGNFSNSTFGIESLVNIPKLQDQRLEVKNNASLVDYLYFGSAPNQSLCYPIINTPSWFKIDKQHLKTYEIDPKLGPEGEGYVC